MWLVVSVLGVSRQKNAYCCYCCCCCRYMSCLLLSGLVNCVVMNVRRTPNPSALQLTGPRKEAPKAHLFRYSAGLSLDLARGEDSSIYFVAADDGVVHKCSLNYNEQFLSTYYGHKGPVKTVGAYTSSIFFFKFSSSCLCLSFPLPCCLSFCLCFSSSACCPSYCICLS